MRYSDCLAPFSSATSGSIQSEHKGWFDYFGRTLNQLVWWGQATGEYREKVDPHNMIRDFKSAPSQRNAP